MKKRIFSLLLALCLLSGNCLTVFADETEPASQESTAEAMNTGADTAPAYSGRTGSYPARDTASVSCITSDGTYSACTYAGFSVYRYG